MKANFVDFIITLFLLFSFRAIFKPLTYFTVCCLLGENMKKLQKQKHDVTNRNKLVRGTQIIRDIIITIRNFFSKFSAIFLYFCICENVSRHTSKNMSHIIWMAPKHCINNVQWHYIRRILNQYKPKLTKFY